MAKKASKEVDKALSPDSDTTIPRVKLGEQGFLALRTTNGYIYEEQQRAFRYPAFIRTINEMRNNPTVGTAMNVYRFMMTRVPWTVVPHPESDEKDKARADIVRTMMDDMDHSWGSFIESIIPYLEYGFAINEKVYRRRLYKNGSKFNDGLIGLKKLPTRNQDSIRRWQFSDDGGELLNVQQTLQYMEHQGLYTDRLNDKGLIEIDRNKFLLFTTNPTKGNPQGNSLFKNIYLAYKQMTLLQENLLMGIAKDVQGILKIEIPPKYLSPDASPEDQATAKAFQQIIDNYNAGTQRGLLVPNFIDTESKLKMFEYSLMESKGTAKYDTQKAILALQQDILAALNVDVVQLGNNGSGSYSLAESKTSILSLAVDSKLREIKEVLNQDLMRSIYELNGWNCERLPSFEYGDIQQPDLDSLGAFLQRVKAVGLLEVDRPVLNVIRKALGVPERDKDEEPDMEAMNMGKTETRSGDSFNTDTGGISGTSNSVSERDNSVANKENAP